MCVMQRPNNTWKIHFHKEFPQITALQPFLKLDDPLLTRHVTLESGAAPSPPTATRWRWTYCVSPPTSGSSASDLSYEQTVNAQLRHPVLPHFHRCHCYNTGEISIPLSNCLHPLRWLTLAPPHYTQTFHEAESPWCRCCFKVEGKKPFADF